ncbi:MAG: hypothetical protein KIT09_33830 [Bryobacteraceae bacterium]|nr:hypothetical protein [Bryobacteraceae bacterium]
MCNSVILAAAGSILAAGAAVAQETVKIDFPAEAPLSVVSADWSSTRTDPRGGALVVDLHTSLRLRNAGQATIRGVTLLVLAQEVTPGGKASVTVPSLSAGAGEVFPVRIDLRLLRPSQTAAGPLVRIQLDGVLFDDLSFYGPNKLNSRRAMTAWELEARRDRQYLKSVLAARGPEGLREEVLVSMAREAERPRLDVQIARRGRATNWDAAPAVQFAFLRFPDSPVDPVAGMARMAGQEAGGATLEVRNRSDRPIRYLEIGWIFQDRQNREYLAGSVPAEVTIAPGQTSRIATETSLRFTQPFAVEAMKGFVSQVEFEDGRVWIPSRSDLRDRELEPLLAPSPEEQRLTNIYRKKGLRGLVEELNRF